MKIMLLLKTPELEVDILSVENQCGTPVRYPDFNNYGSVEPNEVDGKENVLNHLELELETERTVSIERS